MPTLDTSCKRLEKERNNGNGKFCSRHGCSVQYEHGNAQVRLEGKEVTNQ
jgi:hypothetical protein